jgi:predicted secreted Zn-dependent protease
MMHRLSARYIFFILPVFLIACTSRVTEIEIINEPVREELYAVGGSSISEVIASIRSRMVGGFAGYASVNIYYEYQTDTSLFGDCKVKKMKITTKPSINVPEWKSSGSFEASMLPNWLRYINALRVHEEGHIEIGLATASSFASKFAYPNKVQASNCRELDTLIRQVFDSEMAINKQENLTYDKVTSHGKTQGTDFVWN